MDQGGASGTVEVKVMRMPWFGDRLGLLYVTSQALIEAELDISLAKISTEKGAAIDSFYVHERGGGKILSTDRQNLIKEKILQAIARSRVKSRNERSADRRVRACITLAFLSSRGHGCPRPCSRLPQ